MYSLLQRINSHFPSLHGIKTNDSLLGFIGFLELLLPPSRITSTNHLLSDKKILGHPIYLRCTATKSCANTPNNNSLTNTIAATLWPYKRYCHWNDLALCTITHLPWELPCTFLCGKTSWHGLPHAPLLTFPTYYHALAMEILQCMIECWSYISLIFLIMLMRWLIWSCILKYMNFLIFRDFFGNLLNFL